MPESRGRKKPQPVKRPMKRPPRKMVASEVPEPRPEPPRPDRSPAREIPEDQRYKVTELPEPATRDQLLVALAGLDPLAQEVMIGQRLAAMPSQMEGGLPVNIPRMVRGPWAHQLRKLGVFCIPELATHELVAPDGTGLLQNHTASTLRSIDTKDLWEIAKEQNPEIAKLVDEADTPEKKQEAMRILSSKLPVQQRLALERLMRTPVEDLEPQ